MNANITFHSGETVFLKNVFMAGAGLAGVLPNGEDVWYSDNIIATVHISA